MYWGLPDRPGATESEDGVKALVSRRLIPDRASRSPLVPSPELWWNLLEFSAVCPNAARGNRLQGSSLQVHLGLHECALDGLCEGFVGVLTGPSLRHRLPYCIAGTMGTGPWLQAFLKIVFDF
jgi:hypothetical protein